jgi:hypothetical protein
MNTLGRAAIMLVCVIGLPAPLAARDGSGDGTIAQGRYFATLACRPCHIVSPDQKSPPILQKPGPTFSAIANNSATTAETLRVFLSTNHAAIGPAERMPNPRLLDYQIDEVIAYILSLRKTP